MMRTRMAFALCAGLIVLSGLAHAQDEDPTARARAALRTATQRIRELEDQNATLQAKAAEVDRAQQGLTQRLAADEKELADLRKQTDADKTAIQQTSSALASQREANAKLQGTYQETATTLQTRDAEAKRLDSTLSQARQRILACEAKNAELYKQAESVLDLYDKRDLLDAVASSEPVTKLKRVEIENVMQEYEDKFRADKISQPPQ